MPVCTELLLQTTRRKPPEEKKQNTCIISYKMFYVPCSQALWCRACPSMVDATFSQFFILVFLVLAERRSSRWLSHWRQWKPCSPLPCLAALLPPLLQARSDSFRALHGESVKQISRVHTSVAPREKTSWKLNSHRRFLPFFLSTRLLVSSLHIVTWSSGRSDGFSWPTGSPTAPHSEFFDVCLPFWAFF